MSLLKPSTALIPAAKIGAFGGMSSGKTLSSILIAIGLSKHYHQNAPIAFFDTEDGSPFVQEICDIEGVPLLSIQSKSFVDMRDSLVEAESVGCCVFIADSYSHPWKELNEALKVKLGIVGRRLQYHHREELDQLWGEWVSAMLTSPLHCILAGRLGYEWDRGEDEAGDETLTKLGTKMKGETSAGYEPHLLIELEAIQDKAAREKVTKRKKGTTKHHIYVLKDRTRALNGLAFKFNDMNGYVPDAYRPVFDAFVPHFAKLAIGQARPQSVARSSTGLFLASSGESAYAERERRVTIAIEDFKATIDLLWPGTTNQAKACHAAAIEAIFGERSWTAVQAKSAETVEAGAQLLRLCEAALPREADGVAPSTRAEVIAWILSVKADQVAEAVL